MKPKPSHTKKEIFLLLALFFVVMIIGVVFYHRVEQFSWIDSIYFTTITLTTLGYGDIVVKTDVGKLFTSFYAFLGIATFLGIAGIVFYNTIGLPRAQDKSEDKDQVSD